MKINKIIALRGKANVGKSTTIRILHNLLIQENFKILKTTINGYGGDFISIFEKNGILIGLTSSGDTYDLVHDKLQELIDNNCEICICASRTYDRVPPGTNAAIKEFSDFSNEFIDKTIDYNMPTQNKTNEKDANKLLSEIISLI